MTTETTTPSTWTCECGRANADLPDVRFCAGCGKRRAREGGALAFAIVTAWAPGLAVTPFERWSVASQDGAFDALAKASEVLGVDKLQARIAELEVRLANEKTAREGYRVLDAQFEAYTKAIAEVATLINRPHPRSEAEHVAAENACWERLRKLRDACRTAPAGACPRDTLPCRYANECDGTACRGRDDEAACACNPTLAFPQREQAGPHHHRACPLYSRSAGGETTPASAPQPVEAKGKCADGYVSACESDFRRRTGVEQSTTVASAPQPGELTTEAVRAWMGNDEDTRELEDVVKLDVRANVARATEAVESRIVEKLQRFINGNPDSVRKEFSNIDSVLGELHRHLAVLEDWNGEKARATAELRKQSEADKATIAELRARIDELKESWSGLNDANNEKASEIAELRRQHDEDTLALRVIRKSAAETANDRDREYSRVEKAEAERDAARAELAQAKVSATNWERAYDKVCRERDEVKGKLERRTVLLENWLYGERPIPVEATRAELATDQPAETKPVVG